MNGDRAFTHPNLGHQVRIEQFNREVRLTFVCHTREAADALTEDMLRQIKDGALSLTLMGKPTSVEEDR